MRRMKKIHTPILLLAFILGFTVHAYSQNVEESAEGNLPLPSALISKHIEAVGGETAIRSHTAQTLEGKFIIQSMGIEGDITVIAAAPNKMKSTVQLGQYGTSRSGYNGTVGWSMDAMSGNRVLEGEALEQVVDRADFYGYDLHLGNKAVQQKTIETVTLEDGEHYKVLLKEADGEETTLYFSKDTGLLSGIDRMELGMTGKVPTQTRLGNYVEHDGVTTARTISSTQNGVKSVLEIESVTYENHPDSAFELPAEIQALTTQ